MRLLLLIIGMVLAAFVIFSAITRRKINKDLAAYNRAEDETLEETFGELTNKSSVREELQQAMMENVSKPFFHTKNEYNVHFNDPLLEAVGKEEKAHYVEDDHEFLKETNEAPPKVNDFVAITIMPKQNGFFAGHLLSAVLKKNHFYLGKQNLFHRHVQDNPNQPILFSIAALMEPGSFDLDEILNESYPGLLMFMMLPCPTVPIASFEKMIGAARQLASTLNGELCDAKREPLTAQTIYQYREQIKNAEKNMLNQSCREDEAW